MGLRYIHLRGRILCYLEKDLGRSVSAKQMGMDLGENWIQVRECLNSLVSQRLVESAMTHRADGRRVGVYTPTALGAVVTSLPYARDCLVTSAAGVRRLNQAVVRTLRIARDAEPGALLIAHLTGEGDLTESNAWALTHRLRDHGLLVKAARTSPMRLRLTRSGREVASQCADPRVPLDAFPLH